jgi:hypothetical protein
MQIETRVHLVDRDGEVIYPRGIVRGDRQIIELTDPPGGKISFKTRDGSGWKQNLGYATHADISAAYTKSQPPASILTTSGKLRGNTETNDGITPAELSDPAPERLGSPMTLKLSTKQFISIFMLQAA